MDTSSFDKLAEEKKTRIIDAGICEFAALPFSQAKTDHITETCNISKGLLFHYFGSKLNFYIYCLEIALSRLTQPTDIASSISNSSFYDFLFAQMDAKMTVCKMYPNETHFVNMVSRESLKDIVVLSQPIFAKYKSLRANTSYETLQRAICLLPLQQTPTPIMVEAIQIFANAIVSQFLLQYQTDPDRFFLESDLVKKKIKDYLDVMIYGLVSPK